MDNHHQVKRIRLTRPAPSGQTERFAQSPFDGVSLDRVSDFSRDGKSQAITILIVGTIPDAQRSSVFSVLVSKDRIEGFAAVQTVRSAEAKVRWRRREVGQVDGVVGRSHEIILSKDDSVDRAATGIELFQDLCVVNRGMSRKPVLRIDEWLVPRKFRGSANGSSIAGSLRMKSGGAHNGLRFPGLPGVATGSLSG